MKNLLQPCAAFVLTCLLALSAYAGEMSAGVTAPPPLPPLQSAIVTLLQSVLALF